MPPKKTSPIRGKKKKDSDVDNTNFIAAPVAAAQDDDDYYREPIKRIVKPENQLLLTEEQLVEEVTRVLTANDPNIPNNISKYNYKVDYVNLYLNCAHHTFTGKGIQARPRGSNGQPCISPSN